MSILHAPAISRRTGRQKPAGFLFVRSPFIGRFLWPNSQKFGHSRLTPNSDLDIGSFSGHTF